MLQVAKALSFLHDDAKLVHGNLTPEAVVINAKARQDGRWCTTCRAVRALTGYKVIVMPPAATSPRATGNWRALHFATRSAWKVTSRPRSITPSLIRRSLPLLSQH